MSAATADPRRGAPSLLVRPLEAGGALTYWQVSATNETRYDVPDQPMHGEMDPFFFLTKHKNFIPHEYPCRTIFAEAFGGKRPEPQGEFVAATNRLPFGARLLDLSGFWFRATRLGTWAKTVIVAEEAGRAQFELGTCGGAVLFVNGREIGWIAGYVRNLENRTTLEADLEAGENDILVYFDDLAERDTRYLLRLDYISGPKAAQALAVDCDPAIATRVEAALDDMRFEHPVYRGGLVALVTGAPIPVETTASITVSGDFMSAERIAYEVRVEAGASRIPVADAEALPADFRHFDVCLSAGGFSASRLFGVEISHADRQGAAPTTLDARLTEALNAVAERGEDDTVRAVARLATGQAGPVTEQAIRVSLPIIEDCDDCADFHLVPLLWCRLAFADVLAPELLSRIDRAILGYRFWMDEPGNDVQWYFSENHALLFHTSAYLAGHCLGDATFVRSGRQGREQSAVGRDRVRAWLDHFEAWEMAEFNSAPYFPIDLTGLTALYALAPDADIRERAGKAIVRLLEVVARSAHHGIMTGAQGRSYEHTLRASGSLELSAMARMIWGTGGSFGRRFHALPQLATCLRDHGLAVPPHLAAIADFADAGEQEWNFAQGQDRIAKLTHIKSRDYAMGSIAAYRWYEWGYQETVLQLRLGTNPDAQIWINHPGEIIHSGYGRPSYWGGCGSVPRVQQYRGLAIVDVRAAPEQAGFSHAWFPQEAFDEVGLGGAVAAARSGEGMVLLKGSSPLRLVETGPTAGNELRLDGHCGTWTVRLGSVSEFETLSGFVQGFEGLEVREHPSGTWCVDDPVYGPVLLHGDGRIEAEGRVIDPRSWTIGGEARILPSGTLSDRARPHVI